MITLNLAGARTATRAPLVSPRVRRWLRSAWCVAWNGKHELYRARSDDRLYQQCLLCGHETAGWTIDRRDRRTH